MSSDVTPSRSAIDVCTYSPAARVVVTSAVITKVTEPSSLAPSVNPAKAVVQVATPAVNESVPTLVAVPSMPTFTPAKTISELVEVVITNLDNTAFNSVLSAVFLLLPLSKVKVYLPIVLDKPPVRTPSDIALTTELSLEPTIVAVLLVPALLVTSVAAPDSLPIAVGVAVKE